ncbi:MAG: hypothetical protein HZC41_00230 [Chloroflexi bacterium]|nr:hypothetical protein [Chloroflexota bacterium]
MFHDRTSPAETWPFDHLIATLLKQFKRPLAAHGVTLTDAEAQQIGQAVAARQSSDETVARVRAALVEVIAESEAVLARWGLSFAESLQTGVDALPGWESTAEFLALAEEKANAEIRIGAGAALLAALGDLRYANYLFQQIERAPDEVEAIIARRVLFFVTGMDAGTPAGLEQARQWLNRRAIT